MASLSRESLYTSLLNQNVCFMEKSFVVQNNTDAIDLLCAGGSSDGEGEEVVKTLQKVNSATVGNSLKHAKLQLVEGGKPLIPGHFPSARVRQKLDLDNLGNDRDLNIESSREDLDSNSEGDAKLFIS